MIARFLAEPGSTMGGLPQPAGSAALSLTLAKIGLGTEPPLCIHAAAICSGVAKRVLAVNRCSHPAKIALGSACGKLGGKGLSSASGYSSIETYNASVSAPGRQWAKAAGPQPWGPMTPVAEPGGTGDPVLQPFALSVVSLK